MAPHGEKKSLSPTQPSEQFTVTLPTELQGQMVENLFGRCFTCKDSGRKIAYAQQNSEAISVYIGHYDST